MTAEDRAKNAGKVALVLEGGSFRGQFTAGVLDVLMEVGVEIPAVYGVSAGALARGLKTLTRFLYARALRRVRFSAVSVCNKKAGRNTSLPACNYWWRRGESNSGPRKPPDWHLQAQSLVLSRTLCAQRHARGIPTGSVLARAIPITCAGAFP